MEGQSENENNGAAYHGHKQCAETLLKHGADPNATLDSAPSVCGAACARKHHNITDLIASYGGHTDIIFYVNEGKIQEVDNMLNANPAQAQEVLNANNNYSENTSLAMIRLAFKYGADAGKMDHWRLWRYRTIPASLRMVLEYGTDPNVLNHEGVTLLHSYVASGDLVAADLALDFGAAITAPDEGYRGTPLAWAARLGNKEMVTLLLAKGVRSELPDDELWMTPLFWVEFNGHTEISELIWSHTDQNTDAV